MGMITIATYKVDGRGIDVIEQEEEGTGDPFYDLFDEDGSCLNEGDIFWDLPSIEEVKEYLAS